MGEPTAVEEPLVTPRATAIAPNGAGSDAVGAPPCQEAIGKQRSFQNFFAVAFHSDFSSADLSVPSIFAKIFVRISADTASYFPSLFRL